MENHVTMTANSFTPSLIDRLTGDADTGPASSFPKAVDSLKQAILSDLVDLLNARARCTEWLDEYDALNNTLLDYGLPDFAGRDFATDEDREFLKRSVAEAIRNFEPRLKSVTVELSSTENALDGRVQMEIIGGLVVDPDDQFSFAVDLIERNGEFQAEAGS